MFKSMKKVFVTASLATFLVAGHGFAGEGCPQKKNIVETAKAAGSFNTLLAAAAAAGLVETLSTAQNITVFAPTDAAFAKLPEGTVEALLEQPEVLKDILLYHVVGAKVPASDAVRLTSATMLNGKDVIVRIEDGKLFLNDSQVIATDIKASNGIIHVIDAVLLP